jgi:hypothetical protein
MLVEAKQLAQYLRQQLQTGTLSTLRASAFRSGASLAVTGAHSGLFTPAVSYHPTLQLALEAKQERMSKMRVRTLKKMGQCDE